MGELEEEILVEREHISTTLRALEETMKRDEKTVIELAAIATFLQNTYNGIENILKRILKFKNISISRSETYHKNLLNLSVEHHIISLELSKKLDEYRAFRHFFTHGYGIMLDKEKLLPLAESLPNIWQSIETEITATMKSLER